MSKIVGHKTPLGRVHPIDLGLDYAIQDFWRIFAGGKYYWRVGTAFYWNSFGPRIKGLAYYMRRPETRDSLMAQRKALL